MASTLLDRRRYRAQDLAGLYHGRWSIGALYKISQRLLRVEQFHGRSDCTVQQELCANCTLVALTRLCAHGSEADLRAAPDRLGRPVLPTNFQHSLRTVLPHLKGLFLAHAALPDQTVQRILQGIAACRQRRRPGRSFPRR